MIGSGATGTYFIDTDSLYQVAKRFDDLERFWLVWGPLADLVASGRLRTVEQVERECRKKSALLTEWMDGLEDFAIPTSDLWVPAKAITSQWRDLAGDEPSEKGDPWLVAAAQVHDNRLGLLDWNNRAVVITQEVARKRAQRVTRIPEVCDLLKIDCDDVWGMFDREGWSVGLVRVAQSGPPDGASGEQVDEDTPSPTV